MKKYILTGGTGFLGSLLGEELLRRGHKVVFLGRHKNDASYRDRQCKALLDISGDVPLLHAVFYEIDFANPVLTSDAVAQLRGSDGFFHLAADLSFRERDRQKVFQANVHSLAKITDLISLLETPLFYTSTAYVHGAQSPGTVIQEKLYTRPKQFNNPYEESKYEAEVFLHAWGKRTGHPYVIFRPSIIIDREGKASTPYGFSAVLIGLLKLREHFKTPQGKLLRLPMPFPYARNASLNLVPADLVIRWMIHIAEHERARGETYHLVSARPFSIREIIDDAFVKGIGVRLMAFSAPLWLVHLWITMLSCIGDLIPMLKPLTERLRLFRFYMTGDVRYATDNLASATGDDLGELSRVPHGYLTQVAQHFVARYNKRKLGL